MTSNGRRRSPRLLELEAKKKEQPTCHATQDESYQRRKKKVRTMPDQELGSSYPTNPLSGSSNVSAPWNTSSNLSGKSVQAPNQHTGRFSFMNASCGDGNCHSVIPRAGENSKDLIMAEVRNASLRREYEKIYGVSPSTPGLWNFPIRLQQPNNLYKPFNQQGGNASTFGTGRKVLQLSDIDEWLGSGGSQERTNSETPRDNSLEQSADGNKTFPWTIDVLKRLWSRWKNG